RFQANPEKYLHGGPSAPMDSHLPVETGLAPAGQGGATQYVCPMDPDVVSDKPGACPKCGMALEPRLAAPGEGPNPQLVGMRRRFGIGLALSVPVFVLAMGDMVFPAGWHGLGEQVVNWVQLVLASPVVLWCGWPFFERAWASVVNRSPNMFTLIALGVGAAY